MNDPNAFLNENSTLNPISLYADTKVSAENYLMNQDKTNITKPTCLRFSTVYGYSPRIRFDLTVNEFTKELALGRLLEIFGKQFWRPYCHVIDIARSVLKIIEADDKKVGYNVFNVGNTEENYQKGILVDKILEQIPNGRIRYIHKDEDPRDYKVSFKKIKDELDFNTTRTISDGIAEIKKIIEEKYLENPDDAKFRNS
jgi:nucleoside-diphosphate-sugar epimerase